MHVVYVPSINVYPLQLVGVGDAVRGLHLAGLFVSLHGWLHLHVSAWHDQCRKAASPQLHGKICCPLIGCISSAPPWLSWSLYMEEPLHGCLGVL